MAENEIKELLDKHGIKIMIRIKDSMDLDHVKRLKELLETMLESDYLENFTMQFFNFKGSGGILYPEKFEI